MQDDAATRVLVLAGRRRGEADPLGGERRPKALALVGGRPMLERVVDTIREALGPVAVSVSCEDPGLLEATPGLARLAGDGALRHHASRGSPASSVADFLEREAREAPALVTTADHALLTPAMVRHFIASARSAGVDVAAAVVEERVLRARFPEARRTFIRLRGTAVTGANLFWFARARGAEAARFWTKAERVRKQPWKLASLFGALALARFAAGRMDLDEAVERVSAAIGVRAGVVRMPFAESGIDVDTPADLALSQALADAREPAAEARD